MRQIAMLFVMSAAAIHAQTGQITGTLRDDNGTPVAGATVMASLRSSSAPVRPTPGRPPAFMAVRANSATSATGEFRIERLLVGTYVLCVMTSQGAYLDPCAWADQPVSVEMAAGAKVSGVSVVAPKGSIVTVRVQDFQGLLSANPGSDDLRVGTYRGRSPFIPARLIGRDPNGKTMSLVVPRGQGVDVAVSSAGFVLADGTGKTLGAGETKIGVPSSAIPATPPGVGAPAPTVTVQVTGRKGK